jgi:hypothetical protein
MGKTGVTFLPFLVLPYEMCIQLIFDLLERRTLIFGQELSDVPGS